MKKILSILLMLLVVLSLVPLAFAEEDETPEPTLISAEDVDGTEEVGVMTTGKGAEVRLLQLEKAITRNILHGEKIIAKISENESDTTELEAILADLNAILEEVQGLDPEAENAVEEFVDIKKESIELTQEFKKLDGPLLGEEDKLELRKRARQETNAKIKEITEKVKTKVREHNAEQLQKVYGILGLETESISEQLKNGETTIKEINNKIKEEIKSMSQEEKKEALSELKEEGVKRRVSAKVAVEKAKLNAVSRYEKRLEERLKETDNEKAKERIEKRLEVVEKTQERIGDKLEAAKVKNAAKTSAGGDAE